MIEITEEFEYQREACDCCEGYWLIQYHLIVDGIDHGLFFDLEDALECASGASTTLTYTRGDYPG